MRPYILLLSILILLFASGNLWAETPSVTFGDIVVNTNSTFNGRPAIKVNLATTINGAKNKDLICRLFIYDSNKDFLKSRTSAYKYGLTDYYVRNIDLKPHYDNAIYNSIFYYIEPSELILTTGNYQAAVFIIDSQTNQTLSGGLSTKSFTYAEQNASVASTTGANRTSTTSAKSAASSTTPYDFIWLEVMAVATVTCAVAGRTASTAMTMAALGVLAAIGVVSGGAG